VILRPVLRANLFRLGVGACTAGVLTFLLVQLSAWPPHEDETLALFVGRQSLGALGHTVLGQRGGAPLHFCFAWLVVHTGGGLTSLRLVSALFAAASVPVIAALGVRLAGRGPALAACVLGSASWVLLFHGIYGRMYSLFLFTSTLSYLALVVAVARGGRRRWACWGVAAFLAIASHPYGALVFASQGLFVLAGRRRIREALWPFGAVAVLATPMWRSDIVLAGRFDVGVGGGGDKLGSPGSVLDYFDHVAGDFTAGYQVPLIAALLLALTGFVHLLRVRPSAALLTASVIATPAVALMLARLGSSTSPESRHLIFALPFFALLVGVGLVRAAQRVPSVGPVLAAAAIAAFVPAEISWGYHKTPELYRGAPGSVVRARDEAAAWLASTAEPNDVLFGYEPLFLEAWQRARGHMSKLVVPRADPHLAVNALVHARLPLGHGLWVFDAWDTNNYWRRETIRLIYPDPAREFEVRVFGPYLIVRSQEPVVTPQRFLKLSREVELVGKCPGLCIGDADVNLQTVLQAGPRLDRYDASRSRSTVSR
jgi:Dolichyl-phosphate-mannose-protein mannosyltransferase